ncbi:GNAT family N-acetyltransferase [Bacillus sp. FJAT-22090]|uniref:GNAT family N-acetyltransferase n=1 Tax=Bacillus sp. FJAT-22090 TaxID=1581038 RepID=UPI00164301A8|nr:GNAT family N-acetyltransferase [Bacillus sp. FJAT-22090]
MELLVITSMEQLSDYEKEWNFILEETQNTNPFIEFGWVYNWWKHLGEDKNVEILAVRENQHIIAFFPFIYSKTSMIFTYSFIGFGQANYMNVIGYDHSLEFVIEFVIEQIISKRKHVIFNLHGLLKSTASPGKLEVFLRKKKFSYSVHRVITPWINLEKIQMDEYIRKRQKLHRLDKREKRLHQSGTIEVLPAGSEIMDEVFKIYEKRWKKKHDTSSFTKEKDFFRALSKLQNGSVITEIDGLYIDGNMIAFNYGFTCRGKYLGYILAYDNDFESFSPGRILEKEKIQQCSERNIGIFDLSIGYESYKFDWNTDVDYTLKMIFSTNSLIVKTIRRFLSMKERIISRIKLKQSIVLIKRNKIGKIIFVLKNIFKKENSKEAWMEIQSMMKRIGKFLFEWKHYTIYEIARKGTPEVQEHTFNELKLKDALQNPKIAKFHMKEICTKKYRSHRGYYQNDNLKVEDIFWINEKVIRIDELDYLKDFRKSTVVIENWKLDNLVEICSFVKKQSKANKIVVYVRSNSRKERVELEKIGFTVYQHIERKTFFGYSKIAIENAVDSTAL